jgi:ribulose-phosphate 3-epimerase
MEIIPAILETDFKELQSKIKKAESHFKRAQIDVGDGIFVPDKFGCLNKITQLKTEMELEFHLMVAQPWKIIEQLKNSQLRKVSFHYESFFSVPKKNRTFAINNLINSLKKNNYQVAIALNPSTNPSFIYDFLEKIDEVLILGVTPGKQGQKFQEVVLRKVQFLKNLQNNLYIGIDGGVNDKNIQKIVQTQVDRIYIGSFLWKDFKKTIQFLKDKKYL